MDDNFGIEKVAKKAVEKLQKFQWKRSKNCCEKAVQNAWKKYRKLQWKDSNNCSEKTALSQNAVINY